MISDKDKIKQILDVKNMNNVEFCNQVCISAATLTNILKGTTNPSLSVLRNIIEAFPDLNPMWVMMGEGDMFKSSSSDPALPGSTDDNNISMMNKGQQPADDMEDMFGGFRNGLPDAVKPSMSGNPQSRQTPAQVRTAIQQPSINIEEVVGLTLNRLQKPMRKVTEVRIFFDDGTYETFSAK